MPRTIEAIYEDGVFKPVKKVKLSEHERVELTIKGFKHKKKFLWRGALKGREETSVELQHKAKEMW
ncbi:MAG: antitoxin family protein [Deltaproteobacteria bacterium]|nr:antitoxin family protein [Deltaproteobacteria bacterium]